jgi:site-specific DNA-methyltransferase (adenine-specific)
MENYEIYLGKAEDIVPTLNKGSANSIICDPPYGTTGMLCDSVIPFDIMWDFISNIITDGGGIILFGSQPFTTKLIHSNLKQFKYCWVWDKHIPRGFQTAKYRPMNKHEDICVFGKGRINYYPIMIKRDKPVKVKNYSKLSKVSSNDIGKYNDPNKYFVYTHRNPDTIIEGLWEANAGKLHSSQKPVSLMEYLIKTYTKEGDTVLDFAMGSGSTGIACLNTGRKFIGVESDEEYFSMASKRLSEWTPPA